MKPGKIIYFFILLKFLKTQTQHTVQFQCEIGERCKSIIFLNNYSTDLDGNLVFQASVLKNETHFIITRIRLSLCHSQFAPNQVERNQKILLLTFMTIVYLRSAMIFISIVQVEKSNNIIYYFFFIF